jgi:hydrogenase expression/formation protein HypC
MCLAVPGRILSVDASDPVSPIAQVEFGGVVKSANLMYTPEATVGAYVIVHAGFATQVIPEAEAREALEYARQLNQAAASETESLPPVAAGAAPAE